MKWADIVRRVLAWLGWALAFVQFIADHPIPLLQ